MKIVIIKDQEKKTVKTFVVGDSVVITPETAKDLLSCGLTAVISPPAVYHDTWTQTEFEHHLADFLDGVDEVDEMVLSSELEEVES